MKPNLSIPVLFVLIFTSCNQAIDTKKEQDDVLAVLQEEGDAFSAADWSRIAAVHTQNAFDTRMDFHGNGVQLYKGWDEVKGLFESYLKEKLPVQAKNSKDNAIVKINDGSAWVVCDNTWKWTADGKESAFSNVQVACLEKQDGKWKISFDAFVPRHDPKSIDGVFEYLSPGKGQSINRNGRFVYLFNNADGKSMTSSAGTYEVSGDVVKNTIAHCTDSKQIGTSFWWTIKSWAGDTLTYETRNEKGERTGVGRAL